MEAGVSFKKSSKQTEQRSVLFISQFNKKGMYPICSVVHYPSWHVVGSMRSFWSISLSFSFLCMGKGMGKRSNDYMQRSLELT